jgi:hypothetical protein
VAFAMYGQKPVRHDVGVTGWYLGINL